MECIRKMLIFNDFVSPMQFYGMYVSYMIHRALSSGVSYMIHF